MASDTNFSPNGRRRRALHELAGPRGMPMTIRSVRTHQVKERDTGPDGLLSCEIVDCIYPDEPIAVEQTQANGRGRDFTLHHRNGNRYDHRLENLGPAHRGCNSHEFAMRRGKVPRPAAPRAAPLGHSEGYSRAYTPPP